MEKRNLEFVNQAPTQSYLAKMAYNEITRDINTLLNKIKFIEINHGFFHDEECETLREIGKQMANHREYAIEFLEVMEQES